MGRGRRARGSLASARVRDHAVLERGQVYNLAILDVPALADGELTALLEARSGQRDQGGGFAFRLRDPNNYYVARWNPLEKNVGFFVVENGARTTLAKAEVEVDPASGKRCGWWPRESPSSCGWATDRSCA